MVWQKNRYILYRFRNIKVILIKPKTLIKLYNVIIILCVIIVIQGSLTLYQKYRYVKDVYDCSNMSLDCAEYFNSVGIKTRYVQAWLYDNSTNCGKSFHVWLELDFGLFRLPFESTTLLFIPPTVYTDYEEIKISDSYCGNLTQVWGDDIFTR